MFGSWLFGTQLLLYGSRRESQDGSGTIEFPELAPKRWRKSSRALELLIKGYKRRDP